MNEFEKQSSWTNQSALLSWHSNRAAENEWPVSPIPHGTRGTVRFVDDVGTIFPHIHTTIIKHRLKHVTKKKNKIN